MKFSLSKLFKKNYSATIHAPVILRPTIMWHRILLISFIFVLIAGGLSWYLYIQIIRDEAFQATPQKSNSTDLIKHSKLDEVLREYKERETVFRELQVVKPSVIDPSL